MDNLVDLYETLTAPQRLKYEMGCLDDILFSDTGWSDSKDDTTQEAFRNAYISTIEKSCAYHPKWLIENSINIKQRIYQGDRNLTTRLVILCGTYIIFPWYEGRFADQCPHRANQVEHAEFSTKDGFQPVHQFEADRHQRRIDDFDLATRISTHIGLSVTRIVLEYWI